VVTDGPGVIEHHRVLGDPFEDGQRVESLQGELPGGRDLGLGDLRLTGDDDARRGVDERAHHAGERVEGPGSGGDVGHAEAPGESAPGVGGHDRGALVVAGHEALPPVLQQGIGQVHDHATGDEKDLLSPSLVEGVGEVIRHANLHACTHILTRSGEPSSGAAFDGWFPA
jgi:hypothetical protein